MSDIDKARAWLQEAIDDRPEGAYEGRFYHGEAEIFRFLLAQLDASDSATEWGAKWADGGYTPASGVNWAASTTSNQGRDEEFARQHARMWGTRPIRRSVGPWVYADTGEQVWS